MSPRAPVALREVEGHREIADLDRPRALIAQRDRPVEGVAVEDERLTSLEVRGRRQDPDPGQRAIRRGRRSRSGAIVTSSRIEPVVTGANSTTLKVFAVSPYAPLATTSFHVEPS